MKTFNGRKLSSGHFPIKKMGDFLFHEGPIQSHYINDYNEDFLMFWTDADDQFNRWMLVWSDLEMLHSFFSKKINTRDLILKNPKGFVYVIDIDSNGDWKKNTMIYTEEIPFEYLPSRDSFYIVDQYEEYALELKTYIHHHFNRAKKISEIPKS